MSLVWRRRDKLRAVPLARRGLGERSEEKEMDSGDGSPKRIRFSDQVGAGRRGRGKATRLPVCRGGGDTAAESRDSHAAAQPAPCFPGVSPHAPSSQARGVLEPLSLKEIV